KSSEIDIESTGMTLLKLTKTMRMSRTLHDLKEILEKEIESTSYSIPLEMKKKEEEDNDKVRVLYDYKPVCENDLALSVGDIVEVVEDNYGGGWWKGRHCDQEGFLPSNYVELVVDQSQES
uniref:SH3 domain-containing protein n=1 Tax=Clytia hemisphaerica TaxID=252671 RepID=A0A7M5XJ38_9CNID